MTELRQVFKCGGEVFGVEQESMDADEATCLIYRAPDDDSFELKISVPAGVLKLRDKLILTIHINSEVEPDGHMG